MHLAHFEIHFFMFFDQTAPHMRDIMRLASPLALLRGAGDTIGRVRLNAAF